MLKNIKAALKEYYYDPTFNGIDIEARFKEAENQINQANSTYQINTIIAATLLTLDDSHTRFLSPDLAIGVSFGFRMQMIGNTCYLVLLKPGSDAEKKGLRVGDVIYSIEGFQPTRDSLWKISYSYFVLHPPPSLHLTVQEPTGHLKEFLVTAAVREKKRNRVTVGEHSDNVPTFYDLSPDTIICKLPSFDLSEAEVDEMMKRVHEHANLILDLRGNGGGKVLAELRLLGHFFERDTKVADQKTRSQTVQRIAKSRGSKKIFTGKVIVLVDSISASASEVFARVLQLEKRGFVLGDRTRGAVMTSISRVFAFKSPWTYNGPSALYGATITIGDLIMVDGRSLEKTAVTPDEILLPKRADLAGKRDPVLARAAELVGIQLDAEKAAKIFPAQWEDEDHDKSDEKEPK